MKGTTSKIIVGWRNSTFKLLYEKRRITEAEKSKPELDRELLKKRAPELYEFLENKGTKREEVTLSLESSEEWSQNY